MKNSTVGAVSALRAGSALTALACAALLATPAYAQDQGSTAQSSDPTKQNQATSNAPRAGTNAAAVPVGNANAGSSNQEIVITGTIFRRTNTETPSPVTVLSSESLARRGITNVSDAVRSVSADSSGTIPNAFGAGFGAGASAPSLRGLTVNSTLTLVDGQRVTNYPLSDDGQRSFVDLNTMPRVSIERIEVLKDGASSTYGADAIGGVVNVIQRKTFNGLDATLEGGTSQHGGGNEYRGSILAGWGDYDEKGMNFYVGAEYERNNAIYARQRGFPFNTNDLSSLTGGENLNADLNNSGITPTAAAVRPATQLNNNDLLDAIPGSGFVLLNPAQCSAIGGTVTNGDAGQSCTENQVARYGEIQPKTERYGIVARGSVRLSDDIEAYMNLSWYRNNLVTEGLPQALRTTSPIQTSTFVLPNWVCAAGVNCDTAADRRLNPYNPFASAVGDPLTHAGQLYYRFGSADGFNNFAGFRNEVLRGAVGVSGTFGDGWRFQVDGTASQSRLRQTADVVSLLGFEQAIATGTYNLVDPTLNSQAVRDSVILHNDVTATSALYALQGVVTKDLVRLPGGPLQLGVGAHFRHESLDNPDANPTADLIGVNQVNAKGERDIEAGFFELSAPVVKQLELDVSGRYDHYSTGFSNFSPKAGFKFTPIRQVALRGTWSKGFRAPSFAETSGQITGFTTYNPSNFDSGCSQHGGTVQPDGTCAGADSYVRSGQALGFRNNANPNLKPEKSESYTAGVILQPIRQVSLTLDYYHIKKTNIITGGPLSNSALDAYYAGTPLPAGYSIIQNPIDPLFPSGIRTAAIIVGPYANASSLVTSGFDFEAQADFRLAPGVRWSSNFEATRINKYDFRACGDSSDPSCDVQHYVGTQGPYILSSGAGTPRYRGNWSNSFEFGRATLTGTVNYVSGYKMTAEDQNGPGTANDCTTNLYDPGFACKVKSFTWVDLVGSYKLTDAITLYGNVLNLFDAKAPVDPANYAAANYNPTYTQAGAVGRFFRAGVNFSFRPHPAPVVAEPPVVPPPPPPAPVATQTCPDGTVIQATATCPVPPPPPPPPPATKGERG